MFLILTRSILTGDVAQLIEHLPSMHEALGLIAAFQKLDMVANICNLNT